MSIVEDGGPALDPVLLRRSGYAVAIVGVAVGAVALFERAQLLAAADIALAIASAAAVLWAPALFEITTRSRRGRQNLRPQSALLQRRPPWCSSPGSRTTSWISHPC